MKCPYHHDPDAIKARKIELYWLLCYRLWQSNPSQIHHPKLFDLKKEIEMTVIYENITTTDLIRTAISNTQTTDPGMITLEIWRLACILVCNCLPEDLTPTQADQVSDLLAERWHIVTLSDIAAAIKGDHNNWTSINS